jgi:tripartite-type tricarboxylate transporter receptor subunit TctC
MSRWGQKKPGGCVQGVIVGLAGALALLVTSQQAGAQTWPARPIKFIVSQAAGGTPDIICRLITEKLSRALGQQVVVENRPGAGNVIGAHTPARAAPDGYTFFFATAAALVTNPYTFKSLPYDPARDFVPVSMVASNPFFLLANPGLSAKTIPELIALDRNETGKLAAATDGQRNFSGVLTAWFNKRAGTGIVQVPYATMPQGAQDAIAGRVQLVVLAVPSAAPLMEQGQLRGLGVSSAKRLPGFESIPAIAETLPGFDFIGWFALVAPTGTPAEVIARMNREMDGALKDAEIAKRMRDVGMYTEGAATPEATAAYVHAQLEAWGKIIREIGLQPE